MRTPPQYTQPQNLTAGRGANTVSQGGVGQNVQVLPEKGASSRITPPRSSAQDIRQPDKPSYKPDKSFSPSKNAKDFIQNDEFYYDPNDVYSQYFDNSFYPVIKFSSGFTHKTEFGDYGETDIITAEFRARLFEVENFLNTCFDFWLFTDGMYLIDNPGIDALPDGLISAGVDLGIWWRFVNGFSLEFRIAPGTYSDITEPRFSIPTTANLYYVLSPSLSVQLGATARWGWDMVVMPNVGFVWQPNDFLRVRGGVPYSRIDLFPGYMVSFFGTFEWRNTTYALEDSKVLPDEVHFDDIIATAGLTLCLFGQNELSAEAGTYLRREISADVAEDSKIELSEENFVRISIGSRF